MTENIFYVYQYLAEDGSPYYIGKGKENRINDFHKHVIVPPVDRRKIIQSDLSESDALALEMKLIREYGRKVDGGLLDNTKLNQWACTSGWKHSDKAKRTIGEKNTGKVRTEEHRKNYSKAKQEMTDKNIDNIRKAVTNLWADQEYKAKRMEKVMETRIKNGFSRKKTNNEVGNANK